MHPTVDFRSRNETPRTTLTDDGHLEGAFRFRGGQVPLQQALETGVAEGQRCSRFVQNRIGRSPLPLLLLTGEESEKGTSLHESLSFHFDQERFMGKV